MTKRQQRMVAVAALVLGVGLAAAFGFTAFRKNMMYFQTPADLAAGKAAVGAKVRLGGLVQQGSVHRGDGLDVVFTLADCSSKTVKVRFQGILPDLFREGQSVIARGRLEGDVFVADEVLAKHDETYMPPEVAEKIAESHAKAAEIRAAEAAAEGGQP